jgi:hypothetical protein
VKGLPAAFVTLVIGLIAAGIAFRQYRIARAKFKLDLFDRRHAVFLLVLHRLSKEGAAHQSRREPRQTGKDLD